MRKNIVPNYLLRKPLFPGSSCFPISPSPTTNKKIIGLPSSPRDQLNLILKLVGKPT